MEQGRRAEEAGDAGLQMERVQLSRRSPAARDRGGRHYVELEQAEEANLTSGCQHLGEHFAVGGRGTEAVLCSRPTRQVGTTIRCTRGAFSGSGLLRTCSVSVLLSLGAMPFDARIERGDRSKADRRGAKG